ncbi:MAG: hypothetical protein AAF961_03880, partial [Planctomycetota bacterium]
EVFTELAKNLLGNNSSTNKILQLQVFQSVAKPNDNDHDNARYLDKVYDLASSSLMVDFGDLDTDPPMLQSRLIDFGGPDLVRT